MNEQKKGTVAANNRAHEGLYPIKNTNHPYHSTVRTVCLILILIGIVLMYVGAYIDMDIITILGIGVGGSAGLITVIMNIEED